MKREHSTNYTCLINPAKSFSKTDKEEKKSDLSGCAFQDHLRHVLQ